MNPDFQYIADLAEYAVMTGETFSGAECVSIVMGWDYIRQAIGGGHAD